MADIVDIVEVTISIQDRAANAPDFGRMLVLAHEPAVDSEEVRRYTLNANGLTAMGNDGFIDTNPAYRMVAAAAAQSPASADILVYSRPAALEQSIKFTPKNVAEGRTYALELDGTAISYTAESGDDEEAVATALQALADAIPTVTATDNTGSFSVAPTGASVKVHASGWRTDRFTVEDETPDASLTDDLNAALELDSVGFYSVLVDANDATNLEAVAGWAESNKKIALFQSFDSDNLTANSGVGATLRDANYNYASVWFSKDMGGYLPAAIGSRQYSRRPGSSTWHMKPSLSGVTFDKLTPTELSNLRGNKVNTYSRTSGVAHTLDGFAASGRFLDITRGVDWMKSEVELAVFNLILNNEKIPYTRAGIEMVKGAILGALLRAARYGVITAESIVVNTPDLSEISVGDRANRLLPDVTFSATLQGAIHKVVVAGTVSV